MHEFTNVLVASSVRYWRMELMHLMYAALHVLMMCCFIERSLSKLKLRLQLVPENSTSVLLRETVYRCGKVVLIQDDDEKWIASVLESQECCYSRTILLEGEKLKVLSHPPYSPDSNCWLYYFGDWPWRKRNFVNLKPYKSREFTTCWLLIMRLWHVILNLLCAILNIHLNCVLGCYNATEEREQQWVLTWDRYKKFF